uniref:Uncharacterized protein n=1 Tax=Laticauda laticaudata TaxID=8630 RepID=A0A8C5S893_LATLA
YLLSSWGNISQLFPFIYKQAKPSTVEVLEKLDKDIQSLEEFREKNQRQQKLWVGRFLLYSSVLYLLICLVIYLWYLPDEWTARFIMTLPLFAFPLIVWSIRTLLIFFFSKRTERNSEYLIFLFFSRFCKNKHGINGVTLYTGDPYLMILIEISKSAPNGCEVENHVT